MKKFSQKYLITGRDIDLNYRLVPMAALAYFEDCFARYAASKFLAAFDVKEQGLYWVISEIDIQFNDDLPFWSETFDVDIWISEMSKIKLYSDFSMSFNGQVFAKGNCCWVVMDKNKSRPASTQLLENKMEIISEFSIGHHKRFEWQESESIQNRLEHLVNMGNIDFNRHVNNMTYLNLAVSCHNETFGFENVIKCVKVRFLQECFVGDKLVCTEYGIDENLCSYKLEKEGKSVCNIIIEWEKLVPKEPIEKYNLKVRETNKVK